MLHQRTRRIARSLFLTVSVLLLAGAGGAGFAFAHRTMDMVLLQMTLYGAWSCLIGAWIGGQVGAALEEDACSELDMGVLSSMGALLGTFSMGLLGTALTGLGLLHPWPAVWLAACSIAVVHATFEWFRPWAIRRMPHLDERGQACADGRRLAPEHQPLRMRDRLSILLSASVIVMLGLTIVMALMMGSDLGHPVMMAPMMYGMFGTMLGGMLGGWLAGLLDEHRGHEDHDNPVMVAAMALMAGMMGGMPSGMIGGMMAVMGDAAILVTVVAGVSLLGLCWWWLIRGRYHFARPTDDQGLPRVATPVAAVAIGVMEVQVRGMTCDACVTRVRRGLGSMPGVVGVDVHLHSGRVQIRWCDGFVGLDAVCDRLAEIGYEAERAP